MLHHKLIAGEQPGTYMVTDFVTDGFDPIGPDTFSRLGL